MPHNLYILTLEWLGPILIDMALAYSIFRSRNWYVQVALGTLLGLLLTFSILSAYAGTPALFWFFAILLCPNLILVSLVYGMVKLRNCYSCLGLGIVTLGVIPIALLFTTFLAAAVYNQVTLIRFAGQLYDYPLPPTTQEIDRWAGIHTNQAHTGNVCWYEVARIVRTDLPRRQFQAYYSRVWFDAIGTNSLALALSGSEGKLPVDIKFRDDEPDGLYVIITLLDGGYGHSDEFIVFDPRCW